MWVQDVELRVKEISCTLVISRQNTRSSGRWCEKQQPQGRDYLLGLCNKRHRGQAGATGAQTLGSRALPIPQPWDPPHPLPQVTREGRGWLSWSCNKASNSNCHSRQQCWLAKEKPAFTFKSLVAGKTGTPSKEYKFPTVKEWDKFPNQPKASSLTGEALASRRCPWAVTWKVWATPGLPFPISHLFPHVPNWSRRLPKNWATGLTEADTEIQTADVY